MDWRKSKLLKDGLQEQEGVLFWSICSQIVREQARKHVKKCKKGPNDLRYHAVGQELGANALSSVNASSNGSS